MFLFSRLKLSTKCRQLEDAGFSRILRRILIYAYSGFPAGTGGFSITTRLPWRDSLPSQ